MVRTYYEKEKRIDKLSTDQKIDLMFDLINSFSQVKNPTDSAKRLEDFLTANEIRNLSVRLRIAKLLLAGITQREISSEFHTSLATINKINVWLNERGDGFRNVISNLPLKWKKPTKFSKGPIEYHLPELIIAMGQYVVVDKQERTIKKFIDKVEEKKNQDREIERFNKETYARPRSKRIKKI
jgi:TrpR-related protein YerC/YecD